MATAYLMVGFAGVGKTTVSKKLASERGAVRLTPDEWMEALFPEPLGMEDFSKYFGRVCNLVRKVASELLVSGKDVVLDIGFWTRESRDHMRELVAGLGARCELIYVDCDRTLIHKRLLERAGSFWSSVDVINGKLAEFEPPQIDEPHIVVKTD
jgi:predicted kinase